MTLWPYMWFCTHHTTNNMYSASDHFESKGKRCCHLPLCVCLSISHLAGALLLSWPWSWTHLLGLCWASDDSCGDWACSHQHGPDKKPFLPSWQQLPLKDTHRHVKKASLVQKSTGNQGAQSFPGNSCGVGISKSKVASITENAMDILPLFEHCSGGSNKWCQLDFSDMIAK